MKPKRRCVLFVAAIVAGAATNTPKFVFGPSEQEIQDKHWEYEQVRAERSRVQGLYGGDDIDQQHKSVDELTNRSLALERTYAKLWVQRGYKIRP
jgi:hypothetical protein